MEKKLKPSLRENKRYLLISGSKKDVEEAILDYIGILGFGQCGIRWIKSNIVAVNRKMVDNVRASLVVSSKDLSVGKVSGTLKGLGNGHRNL